MQVSKGTVINALSDSEAGKALKEYISKRERNRGDTIEIRRLTQILNRRGFKVNKHDVMLELETLEDMAIGTISVDVAGRDIWKWNDLRAMLKASRDVKESKQSMPREYMHFTPKTVRIKRNDITVETDISDLARVLEVLHIK